MSRELSWRYITLALVLSLIPALIILRLVIIQLNPRQVGPIKGLIEEGEMVLHTFYPARGQITDRYGNPLAANRMVYEVGVNLQDVENPHTIAMLLNKVAGLDYKEVYTIASKKYDPVTASYARIKDNVPKEQIDELLKLKKEMEDLYGKSGEADHPSLSGLVFTSHLLRTYPEKTLASNIIGFVAEDDRAPNSYRGYYGVEGKYDALLAGTPRRIPVPRNPNRVIEFPEVPDGASLILTIDREIQHAMEETVDNAIERTGSTSATIVVLDPKTGEILAIATTPRLDLNEYWRLSEVFPPEQKIPFNRAVSQTYEPGSVFKVLTMAAALDAGIVTPDTVFTDTGAFEIGGITIRNWDGGAWGPQTMLGCMQNSLNVCLAWVAWHTGAQKFYSYLKAFGIGRPTGLDLDLEAAGRLKVPGDADWWESDLGTNAFGQSVSVTPVQLASAISAIANDGKLMAPHVVRSIVKDGYQRDTDIQVVSTPVRPETARTLSEMLAVSVQSESYKEALVTGYRIAGKTGTAEIPTEQGYTSSETNASFVGWGPVDDPRFLVYVWLERPKTSQWGSIVAAPVFREAVEKLVILMALPPDDLRHKLYGQ